MPKNSHEIAEFLVNAGLFTVAFTCGAVLIITGIFGYLKRRG